MRWIWLIFIFFFNDSNAQFLLPSVLASGGEVVVLPNFSLSFTIGESIVDEMQSSNVWITQGFQQPFNESAKCLLFFPTAFTPNENNLNDVYKPVTSCQLTEYLFKIYDRWGGVVFASNTIDNGWNGFINNEKAIQGAYVWYCTFKDLNGKLYSKNGYVTIIQ